MQLQKLAGMEISPLRGIRVLLLDDSDYDRQRIRRLGARIADFPLTLDEVATLAELETALKHEIYDVILVDYRLAEGTGLQALDRISATATHYGAGRIMITGREDIDAAVKAMRSGCHDFLPKDTMSAEVLRDAMLNAISLARRNAYVQQQMALQREIFRDCMVATLKDSEVRNSIGAIVQTELAYRSGAQATDGMIAAMANADEFIFRASAG
ncbi:response regulator [Sulfitobacter sp. S0837]|uniref:response regulator n=1 Tax=Sulfitobacter maritimus TaxID=2741719 RepID=UPI001582793A|nr:response regulator [Sulfitobacter maritimus]NUH65792.1 response regulator [Sulfitobacter maritimus]